MVVSGALTKNCMRDMRDLYGLPANPGAEPSSAESAALLLELYEEVRACGLPRPTLSGNSRNLQPCHKVKQRRRRLEGVIRETCFLGDQ